MEEKSLEQSSSGGIGETLKTVVIAVLIAVFVRTFAYEPFNIPSGSMIPTLVVGDYIFVSKFAYGYSHESLPFGPPLFDGRVFDEAPERGDVVVFKYPPDTSIDYIKRVIGLPGDRIQMIEGRLYINGELVPRQPVGEPIVTEGRRAQLYVETLPNGVQHEILEFSDDMGADNTPVYEVPPDHYFMMGDNRDNSRDSRFLRDVGYVPAENLVGRAEIIWFSLDDARFWQVWKWPTNIRFGRLFSGID
ncbi:MAG TPA: signal peptidase I [Alphaproteobacteria bacterium]|nr:signal peptidase I [Alphaproteobacteria bacterium]